MSFDSIPRITPTPNIATISHQVRGSLKVGIRLGIRVTQVYRF